MSRTIRIMSALALACAMVVVPNAAVSADLDDELAEVLSRIDDLEDELTQAAAERSGIVAEILDTRDRLEAARGQLGEAEGALRQIRVSLKGTELELESTQEELAQSYLAIAQTRRNIQDNRGAAQDWIRQQYMRRSEGDMAAIVVATDHVSDLGRMIYIFEAAADKSTALIDRYEALGIEEERQQTRIAAREQQLVTLSEALADDEAHQLVLTSEAADLSALVTRELDAQRGLLGELDDLISHFETELNGLDSEQERLEELIKGSSGGGGSRPGELVRPVPGAITSPFGPRFHPILGYTRMHTGVDMTAPQGQDIRAGADGTVILAENYGGYGLTVIVDHGGGMTTLYAHQSRLFVSRGEAVNAGEAVGEVGSSGLATGPHLHFEVRIDGTPVDPADYL